MPDLVIRKKFPAPVDKATRFSSPATPCIRSKTCPPGKHDGCSDTIDLIYRTNVSIGVSERSVRIGSTAPTAGNPTRLCQ